MKKIFISIRIALSILIMAPVVSAGPTEEFFEKGNQLYQQGDYAKAAEYYEKAVEADSNFALGYNALGLTYKAMGASEPEVAWYFKVATDIDPNYAEAYDNLGKSYYAMGDFTKAEENCQKALSINPKLASAEFSLAWIYLIGKQQPADAIHYFRQIIDKAKIPYAYYGLGLAYYLNHDSAMVLEVITNLRGMNQEKLAAQLEDILRASTPYVPVAPGPLVNVEPPKEGAVKDKGPRTQSLDGAVTKIRMKGRMINLEDKEGKAAGDSSVTPARIQGKAQVINKEGQSTDSSPDTQIQKIRSLQRRRALNY